MEDIQAWEKEGSSASRTAGSFSEVCPPNLPLSPPTSLTIQVPVPLCSSAFGPLKSFHFHPALSPVPRTNQTHWFPEPPKLSPSDEIIPPPPQLSPRMFAVPRPEVSPGCPRVPKDCLQVSPKLPSLLPNSPKCTSQAFPGVPGSPTSLPAGGSTLPEVYFQPAPQFCPSSPPHTDRVSTLPGRPAPWPPPPPAPAPNSLGRQLTSGDARSHLGLPAAERA